MSGEIPKVGDASHLVEDPQPYKTVNKTMVPVHANVEGVEQHGQMKGVVEQVVTKEQVAEETKRIKEPCTKCRYFYYPKDDSQEYKEIRARLAAIISQLPDFQKAHFPGYTNAHEWGVCKKLNGMIHCIGNTCEHWKPRGLWAAFGMHTAKDRRDA